MKASKPQNYQHYFQEHYQMPVDGYILGLDLGIASIGWSAVLADESDMPLGLLDAGVRTFPKAETEDGKSLSLARREARSTRRRIRRRAFRMQRLRHLLQQEGILQANDFDSDGLTIGLPINSWVLRTEGLDRLLTPKEWAAVLLHLVKHRGYLSTRKSEASQDDKELGRLLSGVHNNHTLLQNKAFRSPAELAINHFLPQSNHLRNKGGNYSHTFSRLDIQKELHDLFVAQRRLNNPFTSEAFEQKVDNLLMAQREALQGKAVLKMIGKCSLEIDQPRAAKHSYSAERFIWLNKLNNLRIQDQGKERALTDNERNELLPLPYQKSKLTYTQVRNALNLPETAIFKNIYYKPDESLKKTENQTLMEMKSYHAIRLTLQKAGLEAEWANLSANPQLLDVIGTTLSIYKTDNDIRAELSQHPLSENTIEALLSLSFDKFISLSLAALNQLLPLMEQGKRFDEAKETLYPNQGNDTEKSLLLPHIPTDQIRNPVVLRCLTQTRKVVNEIIRRYGTPKRIHIETGRELGKSFADRKKIERQQNINRKEREDAAAELKQQFSHFLGEPKNNDILKMRLYNQQQGKCLYSGKAINVNRLYEPGFVEIDHALPFSRTWDDSFNNKVLVLASENQNKRDRTPYEYLNGSSNSKAWQGYQARVNGSAFPATKKQRLLLTHLDEKDFLERNINDTRYISRFITNFIEQNLYLAGKGKRKVFASNGQLTAFLRYHWGLRKTRDNDRHHAVDAIVVACTTPSIQQKITNFIRQKELHPYQGEMVDHKTGEIKRLHFPSPWQFFHKEVALRIFEDIPFQADTHQWALALQEKIKAALPDRPEAIHPWVTPLFVSRKPNRKVQGRGHEETIRSAKYLNDSISVCKIPLTKLKPKDITQIIGYPSREEAFYKALEQRLAEHQNNPEKAFAEPFYKPSKIKGQQGSLVRSVKVATIQKSGIPVRKGIADADSLVRIDIFHKNGKNYAIPVYAWQIEMHQMPMKAVKALTDEDGWDPIDNSFTFQFSLYKNDLIEIVTKKGRFFGYYNGFDRANGSIKLRIHDTNIHQVKNGIYQGIGIKTALSITKYHIDILGKTIRPSKPEKRQLF